MLNAKQELYFILLLYLPQHLVECWSYTRCLFNAKYIDFKFLSLCPKITCNFGFLSMTPIDKYINSSGNQHVDSHWNPERFTFLYKNTANTVNTSFLMCLVGKVREMGKAFLSFLLLQSNFSEPNLHFLFQLFINIFTTFLGN